MFKMPRLLSGHDGKLCCMSQVLAKSIPTPRRLGKVIECQYCQEKTSTHFPYWCGKRSRERGTPFPLGYNTVADKQRQSQQQQQPQQQQQQPRQQQPQWQPRGGRSDVGNLKEVAKLFVNFGEQVGILFSEESAPRPPGKVKALPAPLDSN